MTAQTQDAAGYYVWEPAGKSVVVWLHLDALDRILADVMKGFGAVPRRGAEVGGVLIGVIQHPEEPGEKTIVRVEDFELVDCEHKRGPSYLFLDADRGVFDTAALRWEPDESRATFAVGFFRSHTRDGMSLDEEDVALMDDNFPAPAQVALLIKPFGTRVSVAGFFYREDGVFQETTPLEFPFRRRELTGEEGPPRRTLEQRAMERRERGTRGARPSAQMADPAEEYETPMRVAPAQLGPRQVAPVYTAPAPSRSKMRSSIWIPLSFVFLVVGVALGFMMRGPLTRGVADFSLGLVVAKADGAAGVATSEAGYNLSVKWDRSAAAVRAAQRGVLEIEDGKYNKSVDLDTAQLASGNLVYRNSSAAVKFRLTVYPRNRVSVTETAEWRQ